MYALCNSTSMHSILIYHKHLNSNFKERYLNWSKSSANIVHRNKSHEIAFTIIVLNRNLILNLSETNILLSCDTFISTLYKVQLFWKDSNLNSFCLFVTLKGKYKTLENSFQNSCECSWVDIKSVTNCYCWGHGKFLTKF